MPAPRNHVALALLKRGGGTKRHVKSCKANRQEGKRAIKRELLC